jgi:NAD(P)-dependent dehydrogenase (short-subunit alcohol dehydrogenase family)
MDLELRGKLALVSGSTAGIGLAIATALAAEGARVIINGRTQAAVDAAVAALASGAGTPVLGFAGDLATEAAAEALARQHPGVEILINNLGIFEPKAFQDIPDADWRRLFEVNVLSGVRLARLFLPAMRRANWGRIIFISPCRAAWPNRWRAPASRSTVSYRDRPNHGAWSTSSTPWPPLTGVPSKRSSRSSSTRYARAP